MLLSSIGIDFPALEIKRGQLGLQSKLFFDVEVNAVDKEG